MALVPKAIRDFYKSRSFEDPTVACGVWPFTTGPNDPMLNACAWHDKAYEEGSWYQEHMTRREVDQMFLSQMLIIAKDSKTLKLRAYTYYAVVRALGWMFWEGEDARRRKN